MGRIHGGAHTPSPRRSCRPALLSTGAFRRGRQPLAAGGVPVGCRGDGAPRPGESGSPASLARAGGHHEHLHTASRALSGPQPANVPAFFRAGRSQAFTGARRSSSAHARRSAAAAWPGCWRRWRCPPAGQQQFGRPGGGQAIKRRQPSARGGAGWSGHPAGGAARFRSGSRLRRPPGLEGRRREGAGPGPTTAPARSRREGQRQCRVIAAHGDVVRQAARASCCHVSVRRAKAACRASARLQRAGHEFGGGPPVASLLPDGSAGGGKFSALAVAPPSPAKSCSPDRHQALGVVAGLAGKLCKGGPRLARSPTAWWARPRLLSRRAVGAGLGQQLWRYGKAAGASPSCW